MSESKTKLQQVGYHSARVGLHSARLVLVSTDLFLSSIQWVTLKLDCFLSKQLSKGLPEEEKGISETSMSMMSDARVALLGANWSDLKGVGGQLWEDTTKVFISMFSSSTPAPKPAGSVTETNIDSK